jgi:sigma-B regulation protein RsbU (phosphoserine phosphatase)
VDYRKLMKKVEEVVSAIAQVDITAATIQGLLDSLVRQFRDELGIYGGRLYRREGEEFVLEGTFGEAKAVPRGLRVPASYRPVHTLLEERILCMEADDPQLDSSLEERLGVGGQFAAIEVGDQDYILAFDVAPGHDREGTLYSLGILRSSINQKIRQERVQDALRQAREIQRSILPHDLPHYGDFDIYGRSRPLETVGGDHYDFIPITDKIMGLAMADVSGHGLPAALQVRDIHMGLRMGLSRDYKIVRTVERLNAIIHHSTLTSRFVSMFYGELESSGMFIYVNAGHTAPFHLAADGQVTYLTEGGAVLGPLADATYERGFVGVCPGDLLVLYTDGIIEAEGHGGGEKSEEFGIQRLVETARAHQRESSAEVVAAIFEAVERFAASAPPKDDRTVVVVKRP